MREYLVAEADVAALPTAQKKKPVKEYWVEAVLQELDRRYGGWAQEDADVDEDEGGEKNR